MTRFYIGYVLAGMLIAKDKVELELRIHVWFWELWFGWEETRCRTTAFETVRKKKKTTKKHGNQFGWEETRKSVYRYIDICIYI